MFFNNYQWTGQHLSVKMMYYISTTFKLVTSGQTFRPE